MTIETLKEFKARIAKLPKEEVIKLRNSIYNLLDVAFKMRKIYGMQVYDDMFAKYLACVDLTT
jgi:hypothetical protein